MDALEDPVALWMAILGLVMILAATLERRGWLEPKNKDGNKDGKKLKEPAAEPRENKDL